MLLGGTYEVLANRMCESAAVDDRGYLAVVWENQRGEDVKWARVIFTSTSIYLRVDSIRAILSVGFMEDQFEKSRAVPCQLRSFTNVLHGVIHK